MRVPYSETPTQVTDSDEDRVRREVRFMFQTGEHPNIVSLLGVLLWLQ